jgi:hypothetical protein
MLSTGSPIVDLYRGLYRVEVSGWDKNQAFFVEKSDLEWTENSGKRVVLSHELPDRAVVFVRLLRMLSADRSHSVPYEVEFVAVTPEGQRQFRLRAVRPRAVEGCVVN